jgi:hypothetical protein
VTITLPDAGKRFMSMQVISQVAWQGALPTDKFGPACMQTDDVPKSEDC